MPLRMLIDGGAVQADDVVLVGARNLDPGEAEYIDEVGLPVGLDGLQRALTGVDAVYVALDCDVLDPGEGVEVFVPEPDGLSLADVELVLERLTERSRLAGAGLTGLVASSANEPALARLCAALGL